MDKLNPERRSWLMSRIRGANTKPELAVRSLLHGMGYRFRLHRKGLPGTPDIVLPGRSAAVFVHGCSWHGHACKTAEMPKSSSDYWRRKSRATAGGTAASVGSSQPRGWKVTAVWECELKRPEGLAARLREALSGPLRTAAADPYRKGQ